MPQTDPDPEHVNDDNYADLPALIDSPTQVPVPPQPQVFVHYSYWANIPHTAPIVTSIAYINPDTGEWVVIPAASVRMITDNIGEQFAPRRNGD